MFNPWLALSYGFEAQRVIVDQLVRLARGGIAHADGNPSTSDDLGAVTKTDEITGPARKLIAPPPARRTKSRRRTDPRSKARKVATKAVKKGGATKVDHRSRKKAKSKNAVRGKR